MFEQLGFLIRAISPEKDGENSLDTIFEYFDRLSDFNKSHKLAP